MFMTMNVRRFGILLAFLLLCLAFPVTVVNAEVAPSGPGWMDVQGPLVTPQEADAHYQSLSEFKTFNLLSASVPIGTPEIVALARALKKDPRLIYEYVRNNVEYVPYFGLLKGATLTYLEGAGNDFDQASLMIALLRESGYSARYVYGDMTIPTSGDPNQKDMQHWLKVDPSMIQTIINNGGMIGNASGSNWIVRRVWVELTITNSTGPYPNGIYVLDPAFKPILATSGINLRDAMGYSKSDLLAAAGGTSDVDSVKNVNESGLRNILDGYALSLADFIKSDYPNAQTSDIVGGSKILPQNLISLPTSLDFPVAIVDFWEFDVSDIYVHKVNIKHGGINQPINIPDLAGQKLSIVYKSPIQSQAVQSDILMNIIHLNNEQAVPVQEDVQSSITTKVDIPSPSANRSMSATALPMATTGPYDFGKLICPPTTYPQYPSSSWTFTNPNPVAIRLVSTFSNNPYNAFVLTTSSGATDTTLQPGSSVTVTVTFTNIAQIPGTKTGQLRIQWLQTNGVSFGDNYYNLTGYIANASDLTDSYGFNYGVQYLGNPVNGTVRLKNSGSLGLTITSITLTGADTGSFQITGGNQAGTLLSSQYRDIAVRYLANSVGTQFAAVHVVFSYDGVDQSIDLKLTGQTIATPIAQLWLDDQMIAEEVEPVTGTNLDEMTIC
jgi:Transglutaminase-like superfamily